MTVPIHVGDVRAILPTLTAGSVRCCVTSPPYFGLRSYFPDAVRLSPGLSPEQRAEIIAELDILGVSPILRT